MSNEGFSLLGFMIFATMMSTMVLCSTKFFASSHRAAQRIKDRQVIEQLRQNVQIAVSATKTSEGVQAGCENRFIALKQEGGADFITIPTQNKYSKIGTYSVRAICVGAGTAYQVEVTKFENDKTSWKQLFKEPRTLKSVKG